jgi:N-acetylmuramoyl-L-alanine amidase
MASHLRSFSCGLTILGTIVSAFALSSPDAVNMQPGRSSSAAFGAVRRAIPVSEGSSRNRSNPGTRPSTTTVIIDAGHGGHDRGGIPGQRIAEKTVTLDVAQRLKAVLTANGYRVIMTRQSDVFVPLPTRVAIANSYSDAVFVCIHFNSATRRGASGIETYFYSRESLPLASAVHYYVAGGAPTSNRGVRRRGYYVLRKTRIPAVLVECGFLTNPTEAQYALSVSYRQMLAEEIARGVLGRERVASPAATSPRIAANTVPLQPFIDQTRTVSRSKRSAKKSSKSKSSKKSRKKSSVASDDSEAGKAKTSKKKTPNKHTESSDDGTSGSASKKSGSNTMED